MKPSREELNELIAELTGTDTNTSKNTDTNAFENINIDNLTKEQLFDKENFQAILSISDPSKQAKIILQFEERAKELKVKKPFEEVLNKYQKEHKENKLNNKKTHNEIAEELIEKEKICKYEDDVYIYENGIYSASDKTLGRKILVLKEEATIRFRKEVYEYLRISSKVKETDLNKENNLINFKNGLLNLNDKTFAKHTSEHFLINQINTKYDPNAKKVQAIDDVLDRLCLDKQGEVNKKRRQTILEMIGYSMTTSVKLQKAFVLYGETARNGKSTLLNIITHLFGDDNIGTVSFKDMNKNRFAASGIKGKLLNIGSEMTDEYIDDVETFKKWVTGDYLDIEEKFKACQKISPYTKFIFNANELPVVADKTEGFYRRLQIIPLEHSFTDDNAKKFNFRELVNKEALEYLAKISVEAYINMGISFANIEESNAEVDKYKKTNNSVLTFINDEEYITNVVMRTTSTRFADEVYQCYEEYCKINKYRPIGRNKFYKEIEKSKLILVGTHNHKKTYFFNLDFY